VNEKEIRRIEAKTNRVKLPVDEMIILQWCVIGGAVAAGIYRFVLWVSGRFGDGEPAPWNSIAFEVFWGGLLGAVVAVFFAWTVKRVVYVIGRFTDHCKSRTK